jgi:excinuclease ABC subunit A
VVEHDAEVIRAADWWVDVGPGAGAHGGRILASGLSAEVLQSRESITAGYIRGDAGIPTPDSRRKRGKSAIEIIGAAENNLKKIHARIPIGLFTCVTGVSGSGKSTLVNRILLPAVKRSLGLESPTPGAHEKLTGAKHVERIIEIDQSPIGRSPRSNAATYTGIFDRVRDLFAATREARLRGYGAGRFSFNTKGGRCEACAGQGVRCIEMHFLPDLYVPCAECKGTRYNRETLEIKFRGKGIADVLDMRIEEAIEFFDAFNAIKTSLAALRDVGLDYLAIGQPAHTLSGGEAQRIKLAAELGKQTAGHTLYVLDEPTTGLHFEDIRRLLAVMGRLSNAGHTIVVIEHNLDVIRQADWIIDLGPEGGDAGGRIVVEGTPETVAASQKSHTGRYLRAALNLV